MGDSAIRRLVLIVAFLSAFSAHAATRTFEVTASQWRFDVAESGVPVTNWNVAQGDHVVIHIRSADVTHGFIMNSYVPDHAVTPSLQTIEFDATTPGTFFYACTRPTCGAGHDTMNGEFTVNGDSTVPSITSIEPDSGPTAGGTLVTIEGAGFDGSGTVSFGGVMAGDLNVLNANALTCRTPPHDAGTVDVTVTFTTKDPYEPPYKSGTAPAATREDAFTYLAPPTIASVTPDTGAPEGGTAVIVNGANFGQGATVLFGGAGASDVTVEEPTTIGATTPAHSEGTVDVTVVNDDGQSAIAEGAFVYATVTEPLAIEWISPAGGPPEGGLEFVLSGTGFTAGTTVTFDGAAATGIDVVSPTTITGMTPPHAAGRVDIVVTNPDTVTATMSSGFDYRNPSPRRRSVKRPDDSTATNPEKTKPN